MSAGAATARKRALAQQAFGGYLNTGILVLQGLVLVPLYLRFIGPRSYGLWLASGGVLGLLNVMNIGFGSLLVQRVASSYGEGEPRRAGSYFVNGMAVYLLLSAAFVAVGSAASFVLPGVLRIAGGEADQLRRCFQFAVFGCALGLVNEGLRGFAQGLLRPLLPVFALAGARIAATMGTLYLLYHGAGMWSLPATIVGTEAAVLVCGVLQSALLFRRLGARLRLDRGIIREFLGIGGALFAARVGSALSGEGEPLLIAVLIAPETAAAYTVTKRAADIVFRLVAVVYGSSQGAFSHLAGEGDERRTAAAALRLIGTVFLLGLAGFACYVALNASFVTVWVGRLFLRDHLTTLLVGAGLFSASLRNMVLQILNGLGSFNDTSLVTFVEGGSKFALALLLLKVVGVAGAPLSLLLTSAAALLVLVGRLRRRIAFEIDGGIMARGGLAAALLFGVAGAAERFLEPATSPLAFLAAAAAGLCTVAAVSLALDLGSLPGFSGARLRRQASRR